ncbi:MAG: HAMP domain-containing histidine kinase [Sphingomonadales bacterium]|nr:HAMP domain-containing histidine kinase [Sphingomonadales bacterium]
MHELRTPLGAIAGFAEIIEQQLFGPVSREYRELAQAIVADAQLLLAGFDDISAAARLGGSGRSDGDQSTECNWLAARLAEKLRPVSDNIGAQVHLRIADPVRAFAIDNEFAERLFSRLLSAVILGCSAGEDLVGRFSTELGTPVVNQFALTLPEQLRTVRRRNAWFGFDRGCHAAAWAGIFAAAGTKSCQQRRRQFTVSKGSSASTATSSRK